MITQLWMSPRKCDTPRQKKRAKRRGNNRSISFGIRENRRSYMCTQIMPFNSWQHLYLKTHLNVNRFSFASRAATHFSFHCSRRNAIHWLFTIVFGFICIVSVCEFFFSFSFHISVYFSTYARCTSQCWCPTANRHNKPSSDLWIWTLPSAYNNEPLTIHCLVIKLHISNQWGKRSASATISPFPFPLPQFK